MSREIEKPSQSALQVRPDLTERVQDYVRASDAPATLRARKSDWAKFTAWCATNGQLQTMPASPETVAAFLTDVVATGGAVASVVRYARSIHALHKLARHESPTAHDAVKRVLRGIRRTHGGRQRHKDALTTEIISEFLEKYAQENPTTFLRDRIVILLGVTTALRASELCALNIEDIHRVEGGLVLHRRRSKTDQEGRGRAIAVPAIEPLEFCPVRAIDEWLASTRLRSGRLLRGYKRNGELRDRGITPWLVADIVQRFAACAGRDRRAFGGHSLRVGFVTTARQSGVDWSSIMEQTGHKQLETVKLYTRFTPDVFDATRVQDVFRDAFKKKP